MKIKMSNEEAQGMLKYFEHPHFTNVRNYITIVEVDPKWIEEILPPPLQPAAPVVSIALSEGDQFHGLVMGVNARYGDIVGDWGPAYVMDTDLGVIFGRESLAEPKKLGVTIVLQDNLVDGLSNVQNKLGNVQRRACTNESSRRNSRIDSQRKHGVGRLAGAKKLSLQKPSRHTVSNSKPPKWGLA